MKKTMNVNIGGFAYVIDEDAYRMLKSYLDDIRSRLGDEGADEVMSDIEGRISELFSERITHRNQVVSFEMVRRAMETIGRPEIFGDRKNATPPPYTMKSAATSHEAPRRLYRSRNDRIFGGVCAGIARYFDLDIALVRIVFAILFITSVSLWVYLILWIVIPLEPRHMNSCTDKTTRL